MHWQTKGSEVMIYFPNGYTDFLNGALSLRFIFYSVSSFYIREKNLPVGKHFSFIYITNMPKHYKMGVNRRAPVQRSF